MNLLIVDDEYLIVNEIKNAMEWKKLDISEVYTAFDIRQAKDIISNSAVDIMLCDIEMPGGNGLELLSWVKENYPKTESIFLTCHADFTYAKEAIRLGSLEYILKPVSYKELERAIIKAREKVTSNVRLLEDSRFGKYWFKHLPVLIEHFWFDIINGTIAPTAKAVKKAAEDRNIPFDENMKFLPVLINVRRWHNELNRYDQKTMEFAIRNIAGETVVKNGENGQIIDLGSGRFVILLSLWNYGDLNIDDLKNDCAICIDACHQYLECDLSCYIGEEVYAHEIADITGKLLELDKNNVKYDNNVLLLKSKKSTLHPISLPDMGTWSVMLEHGAADKLLSEVDSYLQNLTKNPYIDANFLKQFHFDFMNMFYAILKKKSINASVLFNNGEFAAHQENAAYSISDTIIWIKYIVGRFDSYCKEAAEQQSLINKAKTYIKNNILHEITREEVAAYLHINPDYLNRIFKRETGISIKKFIIQERLDKAKELLMKTEIPVSSIATSMGYKNFAHFSAIFKKYENINPAEYRKHNSLLQNDKDILKI